jgi:hypothetical protein
MDEINASGVIVRYKNLSIRIPPIFSLFEDLLLIIIWNYAARPPSKYL